MSVSYTLRMPDDLKRLCDSAAKSGGVSTAQLIVDACWKYLEREGDSTPPNGIRDKPIATLADTKPDMDALRAICAGQPISVEMPVLSQCRHKELCEDGEWYGCRLSIGHKGKCVRGERIDL